MKKTAKIISLALCLALVLSALVGCGGEAKTDGQGDAAGADNGDYEFYFRGESEFNDGKTYHFTVTGSKDNSVELLIDELPALGLDGTYVHVAGKGYKLYFDDSSNSLCYTQYDADTKDMTFKYAVNLGEGLGTYRVNFKGHNEAFASEYDGVGLGPEPPTFTGIGWGFAAGTTQIDSKLICREDGTCSLVSDSVVPVDTRNGTYTYDAASNTYHFVFEEQAFDDGAETHMHITDYAEISQEARDVAVSEYDTVYDAATDTYSLTVEVIWYFFCDIHLSYAA